MAKYDVTALGEVLIDFTPAGLSPAGTPLYEANPGGGTANTAAAAGKLGAKAAFIGKTGSDRFGAQIAASLKACNVYTGAMRVSTDQHTTLAFVSLTPEGEREFSFCRNPGADTQLSAAELDADVLKNTAFLHVGSLSLTTEPSRTATFTAVDMVKNAGGFISVDPNWRRVLWPDEKTGIAGMKSIIPFADVLKISDAELFLLAGKEMPQSPVLDDYSKHSGRYLDNGTTLVLVTLGAKGVYYRTKSGDGIVPCRDVRVVDTTGAGDSFIGAVLYRLTRTAYPLAFMQGELEGHLAFANAAASLCTTKRGGIPALPTLDETEKFLYAK